MTKDQEFWAWGRRSHSELVYPAQARAWLRESPIRLNTTDMLMKCLDNPSRTSWTQMLIVADSIMEDGLVTAYEGLRWCIQKRRFPDIQYRSGSMSGGDTSQPICHVGWILRSWRGSRRNRVPIAMLDEVKISDLIGIRNNDQLIRYTPDRKHMYVRSFNVTDQDRITCFEVIMAFHDVGLALEAVAKRAQLVEQTQTLLPFGGRP